MNSKKQKRKEYFIGIGSGNSMKPLINEGDRLFINKAKLNDLQIGDVIIFYERKNFISHRIIRKTINHIISKGDNAPFFDKPLKFNQILGKLARIENRYGFIEIDSYRGSMSKYYFLIYSLCAYYAVRIAYRIVSTVFFGRHLLMKLLVKKQ